MPEAPHNVHQSIENQIRLKVEDVIKMVSRYKQPARDKPLHQRADDKDPDQANQYTEQKRSGERNNRAAK
jgi:hypothetical protein